MMFRTTSTSRLAGSHFKEGESRRLAKYKSVKELASRTTGFQEMKGKLNESGEEEVKKPPKQKLWQIPKVAALQDQIQEYEEKTHELVRENQLILDQISEIESRITEYKKETATKRMNVTDYITMSAIGNLIRHQPTQGSSHGTRKKIYNQPEPNLKEITNMANKRVVDLSTLSSANSIMRNRIDDLRREVMLKNQILNSLLNEEARERFQISKLEDRCRTLANTNSVLKATHEHLKSASRENTKDLKVHLKTMQSEIHLSNIQKRFQRTYSKGGFRSHSPEDFYEDEKSEYRDTEQLGLFGKNSKNLPNSQKPRMKKLAEEQMKTNEQKKKEIKQFEAFLDQFYSVAGVPEKRNLKEVLDRYGAESKEYAKLNSNARFYSEKVEALKDFRDTILEEIRIVQKSKVKYKGDRDFELEDYQAKIADINEQIKKFDKIKDDKKRIINSIRIAIPNIFTKIGCATMEDNIYGDGVVNENNILDYLKTIERRTDEILTMYDAKPEPVATKKDLHSFSAFKKSQISKGEAIDKFSILQNVHNASKHITGEDENKEENPSQSIMAKRSHIVIPTTGTSANDGVLYDVDTIRKQAKKIYESEMGQLHEKSVK